jgi:outer membrane lipoprotein-sorting protein
MRDHRESIYVVGEKRCAAQIVGRAFLILAAALVFGAAASAAFAQNASGSSSAASPAAGTAAATGSSKGSSDPRAAKIVAAVDDKLNLEGLDITDTFTLVQKKSGEADRVIQVKIYRRDAANTFTLLFLYPPSEKGKGYYRYGNDLYLYLPSTREFVYRNRKDDVGSTDVRTDLFGKQTTLDQYDVSYLGRAKVVDWDCDLVRLDAKRLDVSFPIQKWYVRRSDGLPVKVENYSASGTLMRTLYYIAYQEVAPGKYIFTKLLAVDALEKGQETFLSNEGIETKHIPDYVFTKAFLEQQSR